MALYSERQRLLKSAPDILVYDTLEPAVRVKINYAIEDLLGGHHNYIDGWEKTEERYRLVANALRREYGLQRLSQPLHSDDCEEDLKGFVLKEPDCARILDVIELVISVARYCRQRLYHKLVPDRFVSTINDVFRRHAIGYQVESDEVARVDNTYVHAEITKQALVLLSDTKWSGAEQEFRKAHRHYLRGNNKEAIAEAAKSFESVMKTICVARGWVVNPNAASKELLDVCLQNGLIPAFWQAKMGALRSLLESGVPTGRNKRAGHGQGPVPVEVPDHIAGYVLHMAAAAIVFLVKSDEALP